MLVTFLLAVFLSTASATLGSYHLAHPIGWMYQLPAGEQPGWQSPFWVNLEMAHSNIWNPAIDITNQETGKKLTYEADFEQSQAILDIGGAVTSFLSFSWEVPYTFRGGGGMDHFIDQFHIVIGSDRFARAKYAENRNSFSMKVDDEEQLRPSISGVGNTVFKTKLWLAKWQSPTPGLCDCGISVGSRVKIPLASARSGLSSGKVDNSWTVHVGAPLFQQSGLWLSSAVTHVTDSEVLREWPVRRWHQMYEMAMDIGVIGNFGFIFNFRMESPMMNKGSLAIRNTHQYNEEELLERVGSSWNALVYWRGSQAFGLRWHSQNGDQIQFLMVEDWGMGKLDEDKEAVYVNNAPDVGFVLQTKLGF